MNTEKVNDQSKECKSTKIPKRWRDYEPCGELIPGERIIVFKTPLSHEFDKKIKPDERFTPMDLVNDLSQKNIKLRMVVDLTNTDRYYDPKELFDLGILYRKIKCVGKKIPDENVVERFKTDVCTFLNKKSNSDSVVGVHCTHGVNRSGYVVCRYLMECKGYTPEDAIEAFIKARGYDMKYKNDLKDRDNKIPKSIGDNGKRDEISFDRPRPLHTNSRKIEAMDADDILARQVEQPDKEKRELQTRLKTQEEMMDYLALVMRVEEIPLLKQQYEEHLVQDQKFWEEQEEERISRAVSEHKKLVETSGRLQRMVSDKETFVDSLLKARQASHEEKIQEFQARLDDVRKKRLEERRKERILERKVQRRVEREEKERKEKEEREKRERKEAEEKARKEKEEKEREYREKVAKLDEMERKRREREKEIEEREQRASRPDSERDGPPRGLERDRNRDRWGPPRRDEKEEGGSWRRDERERPPPDAGRRREEREPPPPSRDQEEREQDRESTGGWRRGGDGRDDRYRDDRRDDRFRDDRFRDDRFRDGSSGGGWRRDDRDRKGPRDEGSSWRWSGKRDGPRRDMDRGRMDDRGPWRRDDRDRPPPGGGWRDSDDRDRPPPSFRDDRGRDDRWRDDRGREDRGREDRGREERGREDRGREDRWRIERGQDDRGRDDRGRDDRGRDDRGRDDRSMAWRGRDREERDRPSGDSWRGDRDRGDRDRDRDDRYRGDREGDHSRGDRDDRERSGWRNERPDDRDRDRDAWRRGGDDAGRDQWRRDPPPARSEGKSWSASRRGRERPPAEQSDGEGWTTVQYK